MKTVTKYGQRIKELREQKGWTQEHLEELTGIAVRTIQRVESDQTKGPETLAAIAAAFDLTVGELGQRYSVAESKPPTAILIESAADFGVAMQRAHHDYVIQRLTQTNDRVEDLISSITEDLQYISPDEAGLFESFIRSLREPIEEIHALGFGIFAIQQTRDRFIKLTPDARPTAIENWTHGKFIIIPRFGCFRVGGPSSREKLHRFHPGCRDAVRELLTMFKEELQVGVFANALQALLPQPNSEAVDAWCEECFPVQPDGSRLTLAYMALITGRSETELEQLLCGDLGDIPIVGHA
jgi:transcriptional regulator with XRE-family HTH domain